MKAVRRQLSCQVNATGSTLCDFIEGLNFVMVFNNYLVYILGLRHILVGKFTFQGYMSELGCWLYLWSDDTFCHHFFLVVSFNFFSCFVCVFHVALGTFGSTKIQCSPGISPILPNEPGQLFFELSTPIACDGMQIGPRRGYCSWWRLWGISIFWLGVAGTDLVALHFTHQTTNVTVLYYGIILLVDLIMYWLHVRLWFHCQCPHWKNKLT